MNAKMVGMIKSERFVGVPKNKFFRNARLYFAGMHAERKLPIGFIWSKGTSAPARIT